ncbi:glycosyl hydrolase [Sphingobacterium lactis]|uniref:glycosyl hydrolase n=1 Tax=Sphingobacterium lactis TaxID=797291 RepID=UPI003EC70DEF
MMAFLIRNLISLAMVLCTFNLATSQIKGIPEHIVPFAKDSYANAKPWVVWYFMYASYSKEGIKADLEAMAANNIAGAYFTPIKDKKSPVLFNPPTETLSPEWWDMFTYLTTEAKRLGIQIAMFPNDGFATAGGPWITPEMSMQKIVAADTIIQVTNKDSQSIKMPQPEILENYYKDLRMLAYPVKKIYRRSDNEKVKISNSYGEDLSRLAKRGNRIHFASSKPGWFQFEFEEEFTCNSIKVDWNASNYQVNRMKIFASEDGEHFNEVVQLKSPRMGWLDWDNGVTHTIPKTTAKYFRFVYDPEGSEPGAEDLDVAKWKPSVKLTGITLFEEPKVNQFESKTAEIWRVSEFTDSNYINRKDIIEADAIQVLTPKIDDKGNMDVHLPKGIWKILRIGHTSTGHRNETAGAGKGLEADKLNAQAMAFQFEEWYGTAKNKIPKDIADEVLTVYHIDSWECGSQTWTADMEAEFRNRRNYSIDQFWPVLAGYVVNSVEESEAFLYDFRTTISELLNEKGFGTLKAKTEKYGVKFTAETTAPVMVGDGLSHFQFTDNTMGEFWFRSPSHDKPNDVLDAVSAGHIYGKNIVMAEAFTQIRMQWDEHPRLLKPVQDRNYAQGINNLVYHVYVHNPWMDKKPGMTMDGIGILFQRDQVWWKPGKEWVNYGIRSHQLLQSGRPVRDIAVFIGDEIPRRAILPDRLINFIPGIIGANRVAATKKKLENKGIPMRKIADVNTTAGLYRPEEWVDPLRGYAYDSFNPDALSNASEVINGDFVLGNNIAYKLILIPSKHTLNPTGATFSLKTLEKLVETIHNGATVLFEELPKGYKGRLEKEDIQKFNKLVSQLSEGLVSEKIGNTTLRSKDLGLGKLYVGRFLESSFEDLGIKEDIIFDQKDNEVISWLHRTTKNSEIYFIANQDTTSREVNLSVRSKKEYAYLYDAVSDEIQPITYISKNDRAALKLRLDPSQSKFILFSDVLIDAPIWKKQKSEIIKGEWTLKLKDVPHQDLKMDTPRYWTTFSDSDIKYHAGEGNYALNFTMKKPHAGERILLSLTALESMAEIWLNGKQVGVIWTNPFEIDVTEFLREGRNMLEIKVFNTWGNRFWYETQNPDIKVKKMETPAPSKYLKGFLPAGLNGPVSLHWFTREY